MIKTHAALGVGIGARNRSILVKNPQLSDFLFMAQSERFAGFSGEGKSEIGA